MSETLSTQQYLGKKKDIILFQLQIGPGNIILGNLNAHGKINPSINQNA